MLKDCNYDKIKLLHHMCKMAWFIEKHAQDNAEKSGDKECAEACKKLFQDLEKHIAAFKKLS